MRKYSKEKDVYQAAQERFKFIFENFERSNRVVSIKFAQEAWVYKNGIDRLNNDEGYVLSNCVPSCSVCNYGRQDYTVEEYVEHCKKVTYFQERRRGAA